MASTTGRRATKPWPRGRRPSRIRTWAAVAVAATLAGLANAPAPQGGLQHDVDAIADTGAAGVLVEVWGEDGREEAARAGDGVPWNAHYRVGSITKTFTSTVALQLADEGKLSLNDTVEQWLPGMVNGHGNDGSRITVMNLLRQTSGLNDYDEHLPWVEDFTPAAFKRARFRVHRPEELIAWATAGPPQWLPDLHDPAAETRWQYANTNYLLAGMIIEKATGHSLAQEIHDRVIEPLGLRHTYTAGTSAHVPQPRATGWTQFPGQQELVDTSVFVPFPDATVISTAADLTTFYRALLGGDLLSPRQLARMQETVAAPDMWELAPGARYGLGIYWRPAEGCEHGIWYHGGTMPGYLSHVAATPDGSRAVAISTTTWRPGDPRQDHQDAATLHLADNALCANTPPPPFS